MRGFLKIKIHITYCLYFRFFGKVSVLEAHAALFLGNPTDIENLEGLVAKLGEGRSNCSSVIKMAFLLALDSLYHLLLNLESAGLLYLRTLVQTPEEA